MDKYIDRDVLLKAVRRYQPDCSEYDETNPNNFTLQDIAYWAARDMYDNIIFEIKNTDIEDVQPSKVGYWRQRKLEETGNYDLECGNCGFRTVIEPFEMKYANFCINCGMQNKGLIEERGDNGKNECK